MSLESEERSIRSSLAVRMDSVRTHVELNDILTITKYCAELLTNCTKQYLERMQDVHRTKPKVKGSDQESLG